MFMPILSALIVSIDAFFIGLSLGLQKKCKFLSLLIINGFLLGLCLIGFLIAGQVYELIPFDPDLIVGFTFIGLGLWYIFHYFIFERIKRHSKNEKKSSFKTIILVGLVMSFEAMLITMGITFIFLPESNLFIPITVAVAHFAYSTVSFFLARTNSVKRIPLSISVVISGLALIIYGLMALFIEFNI